ncbi:MAG: hypothetical protein UW35_C0010G0011 [Candidatus Collierbacteria bacterium GW2011_GWF2_44_15]|uniref:Uncharacterized protein n=3 Tax=Candidatus Collieribacteriota TaxID=1752725 RepID=A0A0G1KFN6_9BACT|nr:MAG: hypothetical protein UW26_C0006G0004 [Candidatus Collierbacteria bacterium GW2011_GWF1_44_12]KKT46654.1 MAG: hypothetical protein UW35_C0010G0011 [Candidatus Collierbacteria bacterium GW2011_GWF2_44_15]KKU30458.1 MAG: hypothetical protein UX41_C0003G0011 [Candidatus Collierbacteria bacterium GW2011_GWE1_46_18]
MTIKEREDHLRTNLSVYIVVSVILWLGLAIYVAYGLFSLREVPTLPLTITSINVPRFKESNLETLRDSIKPDASRSTNLPVVRVEPYE